MKAVWIFIACYLAAFIGGLFIFDWMIKKLLRL